MFKSATEKRGLEKHLSLSAAVCDRNPANSIPQLKVGASVVVVNVKVTGCKERTYWLELRY